MLQEGVELTELCQFHNIVTKVTLAVEYHTFRRRLMFLDAKAIGVLFQYLFDFFLF